MAAEMIHGEGEEYMDYKGRKADPRKHGGIRAASFACDMLALGGMLEFFYSEAPDSMRSMCTALSWCSTSMGYFNSSVLVTMCNTISGKFGREWLGGHDLNHARLDLFYTLLCILNFINFLCYIYFAKRYEIN